ncbi:MULTISPECIES: metallophosphoesterase family protein [Microbacterium]|uniref:metallophosphoesterase family protein n=1 Tax=Microbacterium TaxID=33882 RepID=UPI000D641A58|nr:metallophosphoesterase family protein [Microbacterium sp. KCTC 39802]
MPLDRIAVISDVHGNLTALEAVLADIGARGITRIVNLGDNVGKGPRGSPTTERLREVCEVNIRGNWDDFIGRLGDEEPEEMRWWRDELSAAQREWLGGLPLSHDLLMSGRLIRLFHASAESPHVRVRFRHTDEEFDGMFRATAMTGDGPEPTVVGYGDVHDAYIHSRDGRTLFNAGSVGNPLDEPTPSYVILEGVLDTAEPAPFEVRFVRVPYDVDAEVAEAERVGMPQRAVWAVELRTAVYRGRQAG